MAEDRHRPIGVSNHGIPRAAWPHSCDFRSLARAIVRIPGSRAECAGATRAACDMPEATRPACDTPEVRHARGDTLGVRHARGPTRRSAVPIPGIACQSLHKPGEGFAFDHCGLTAALASHRRQGPSAALVNRPVSAMWLRSLRRPTAYRKYRGKSALVYVSRWFACPAGLRVPPAHVFGRFRQPAGNRSPIRRHMGYVAIGIPIGGWGQWTNGPERRTAGHRGGPPG